MSKKRDSSAADDADAATSGGDESDVLPTQASKATYAQLHRLDSEILALMNRRAELTIQRVAVRQDDAALPQAGCHKSWQAMVAGNTGPLPDQAIGAVFRELYSGIRAVCQPRRVAFLGPEFTYSYLATIAYFGHGVELAPVGSISAVFEEVERRQADFGVVPIENSTDGRVADALHCLSRSSVQICGEAPLRIRHCLLGLGPRSAVRRVCSKPQALSQCRNWLAKHLPHAALVETASTTAAAEMASRDASTAAIASDSAAAGHSLEVLACHIEDNPNNVTRFAIIGATSAERTGNDKTALVFEAPHEPGALADAMAIFKRQKLNLTWIESFPSAQERGLYLFFVEFQGHASDLRARRALASLAKKALRLTVLGSYAHADPIG